ncbi:MAG: phage tail tape measure protein [Actinomycetota bacterium]
MTAEAGILGRLLVRYGVDTSELDQAQSRLTGTFNNIQSKGMDTAKMLMGMAGLGGTIYATKAVIDEFTSFDDAMQKVKVVAGATGEEFSKLTDLARDMSKETEFSASQIAQGMYELSSAGMDANQQLSIMPAVLDLATAGGIDMSMAAEMVVKSLGGFNMEASEATHVADVMALAVNKSMLHFEDLAYAIKYIAPVAGATGQSIEDMVAAVGLMGNAGIRGEQAGTTLRATFVRLMDPTKEVLEGMKLLNLEAEKLNPTTNSLASMLQYLAEKSMGVDESVRNQAYSMIFGTEALSGMLALVNAGPEALQALSGELANSAGVVEKSAEEMRESTTKQWEIMKNQVMDFAMSAVEGMLPLVNVFFDLTDMVGGAGNAIIMFGSAWAAVKIAKWMSDMGGLSGMFSSITGALHNTSGALTGVAASFGNLALGGAVAGATGVIAYFWGELSKANAALAEAEARLKNVTSSEGYTKSREAADATMGQVSAFASTKMDLITPEMQAQIDHYQSEIGQISRAWLYAKDIGITAMFDQQLAVEGLKAKVADLRLEAAAFTAKGPKYDVAARDAVRHADELQVYLDELMAKWGMLPAKATEAATSLQVVPTAILNALTSQDAAVKGAGAQSMAIYIAGLVEKSGEAPAAAAEVGNLVAEAFSTADPEVQASALETMKHYLDVLVANKQITVEQAEQICNGLVTAMSMDTLDQNLVKDSYRNTLDGIIQLLREKKTTIQQLSDEIGQAAQRGLTVHASPDISYKVPKVYEVMFRNLEGVFSANIPKLESNLALTMPAPAGAGVAMSENHLHVHVDTLVGEERWVGQLAEKMVKALPRAGYGRWQHEPV